MRSPGKEVENTVCKLGYHSLQPYMKKIELLRYKAKKNLKYCDKIVFQLRKNTKNKGNN